MVSPTKQITDRQRAKVTDYRTVFGEYYARENDAVLAAVRLCNKFPENNFGVRYDCIEDLYRVVQLFN